MESRRIGILHPGDMGIALAVAAQHNGNQVFWASAGRSANTRARATRFGLLDAQTVPSLCSACSVVISVCPPHAAETVAHEVIASAFTGLYLDANAISPQRVARIGQAMEDAGIAFVDGGITGGPPWQPGSTRLHLSGPRAWEIAECFSAGPLMTNILGDAIGAASALKMSYSAYTKGTTALLCAVLATAESLGVRDALCGQWALEDPGFGEQASQRVRQVTAKAWRFVGEMEEISATFRTAGLPGDFHAAAAEVYRRLAGFKAAPSTPPLDDVLRALLNTDGTQDL